MNVTSGGPHILLFERDQQLTTLLSSELALAGYEVHTARTAVEVFDSIARFPVRLIMVDLAQAQAGRRELWVALDAQRRGRGVQVFTYRCANIGGFGPDDPDDRVETVVTDMEVDGPESAGLLVDAVRARVPGSTVTTSAPARQAPAAQNTRASETYAQPQPAPQAAPTYQPMQQASPAYQPQPAYQPMQQASPVYQQPQPVYQQPPQPAPQPQPAYQPMQQASPVYQQQPQPAPQAAPVQVVVPTQQASPVYQQMPIPQTPPAAQPQPLQGTLRPQPQEAPPPPARPAENQRAGHSSFTDKIRAVFYPSSQSFSTVSETANTSNNQNQHPAQYQNSDVQPRPRASQRFAEADYPTTQNTREEMYPSPATAPSVAPNQQPYVTYTNAPAAGNGQAVHEESGLDQLSRLLRESQPSPQSAQVYGNVQQQQQPSPQNAQVYGNVQQQQSSPQSAQVYGNVQQQPQPSAARPGLTIDPQEIQDFRSQILQAVRMDEAHERSNTAQVRPVDVPDVRSQLRASPIQDIPFEQEMANRKGPANTIAPAVAENLVRSAMMLPPSAPGQGMQQLSQAAPASFTVASPDTPVAPTDGSQIQEISPQPRHTSGPLSLDEEISLSEQVRASLQQTISRRPEVKTSDDMLLDIVKSLPPMSPAPQPPQPQPQVLNGRATRSLGSVLLEGHLVPQERLQVAQHVQRMLRGVDLNYQLGEILLMFKLLTPDQLLAASLVSYGMISTIQISALGRIRQELHAMGLEYDLESLLILFRILSPEQLREVRASWSS